MRRLVLVAILLAGCKKQPLGNTAEAIPSLKCVTWVGAYYSEDETLLCYTAEGIYLLCPRNEDQGKCIPNLVYR